MSFGGNRPNPPDANQVSQTQLKYGTEAAQAQQRTNMFNQVGPYGSLNYSSDPNSPSGYAANVSLTPEQQALQSGAQNYQQSILGGVGNLTNRYMSGEVPNFSDPNALMQQQLKLQQAYWNPIFEQQQSNMDARLRNQGLTPGAGNNTAWNNAQNLLARNQGDVTNQFMMQMQPITFQEMMQNYQLPGALATQLLGQAGQAKGLQPGMPQFVSTPQAQVQAPNYAQAAQNQYQAQQANYASDQQGMMSMIGTGLSLGLAPFTGGASLMGLGAMGGMGGGGGGMFSGGWG